MVRMFKIRVLTRMYLPSGLHATHVNAPKYDWYTSISLPTSQHMRLPITTHSRLGERINNP